MTNDLDFLFHNRDDQNAIFLPDRRHRRQPFRFGNALYRRRLLPEHQRHRLLMLSDLPGYPDNAVTDPLC